MNTAAVIEFPGANRPTDQQAQAAELPDSDKDGKARMEMWLKGWNALLNASMGTISRMADIIAAIIRVIKALLNRLAQALGIQTSMTEHAPPRQDARNEGAEKDQENAAAKAGLVDGATAAKSAEALASQAPGSGLKVEAEGSAEQLETFRQNMEQIDQALEDLAKGLPKNLELLNSPNAEGIFQHLLGQLKSRLEQLKAQDEALFKEVAPEIMTAAASLGLGQDTEGLLAVWESDAGQSLLQTIDPGGALGNKLKEFKEIRAKAKTFEALYCEFCATGLERERLRPLAEKAISPESGLPRLREAVERIVAERTAGAQAPQDDRQAAQPEGIAESVVLSAQTKKPSKMPEIRDANAANDMFKLPVPPKGALSDDAAPGGFSRFGHLAGVQAGEVFSDEESGFERLREHE